MTFKLFDDGYNQAGNNLFMSGTVLIALSAAWSEVT